MLANLKLDVGNLSTYGGPKGTVPELLCEKKELIPALQQLFIVFPQMRRLRYMGNTHGMFTGEDLP
jgi:hypothetical protein